MKDKSRFISSVIVSLLAGFIYFMFGQDISNNVPDSVKEVLSSNDGNDINDQYLTSDCFSYNSVSTKSGKQINKKKSKFYIKKRNTIEFKDKDVTIPGEKLFSEYISDKQAKFRKPTADKNLDFTSELDNLIKSNSYKTDLKQGREIRNKRSPGIEVADSKGMKSNAYLLHKNAVEFDLGNGFEYNFMTNENSGTPVSKTKERKKKPQSYKSDDTYRSDYSESYCNSDNSNQSKKYNVPDVKVKIKIIAPKVIEKIEDAGADEQEIGIPVEDTNDDSMQ